VSRPPSPVKWLTTSPHFESEHDIRFYRLYCQQVAIQLPGPFQTDLWNRIIPQACEAEPYVRRVVVGFGALNYAVYGKERGQTQSLSLLKSPEYQYALEEYGKGLRGMHSAIASGKHDRRLALIACLIVFLFESLHGSSFAACNNAKGGLLLLEDFQASSTASHPIEDDILRVYEGLDVHVLLFVDTRTPEDHRKTLRRFSRVCSSIPVEFRTLDDVRSFWSAMRRFVFLRRRYFPPESSWEVL